jgi:hypothetical protein
MRTGLTKKTRVLAEWIQIISTFKDYEKHQETSKALLAKLKENKIYLIDKIDAFDIIGRTKKLKNVNEEVAEIATLLVDNFLGKESIDKLGVGATIDIFLILSQPSKWN